jgi:hypothetical protein
MSTDRPQHHPQSHPQARRVIPAGLIVSETRRNAHVAEDRATRSLMRQE